MDVLTQVEILNNDSELFDREFNKLKEFYILDSEKEVQELSEVEKKQSLLIAATTTTIKLGMELGIATMAYMNPEIPNQSYSGVDMLVEGFDEIDKKEACLYVANHQSFMDSLTLIYLFEDPVCFVTKKESRDYPFAGKVCHFIDCIFLTSCVCSVCNCFTCVV